jgi:hypothetical protein
MEKTRSEDLFVNNYRSQGLANKNPETQPIVLVKLIKLGVRSVKGCWLDLGAGNLIDLRGFQQDLQDSRKDLKFTRKGRDLTAKRRGSSSSFG